MNVELLRMAELLPLPCKVFLQSNNEDLGKSHRSITAKHFTEKTFENKVYITIFKICYICPSCDKVKNHYNAFSSPRRKGSPFAPFFLELFGLVHYLWPLSSAEISSSLLSCLLVSAYLPTCLWENANIVFVFGIYFSTSIF